MSRLMPRRLIALFVLMTLASFGGPFLVLVVLQGGPSPDWPPDRAVEWGALAGTTGLVIALMALAISTSIALKKSDARARMAAAGPAASANRTESAPPPPPPRCTA